MKKGLLIVYLLIQQIVMAQYNEKVIFYSKKINKILPSGWEMIVFDNAISISPKDSVQLGTDISTLKGETPYLSKSKYIITIHFKDSESLDIIKTKMHENDSLIKVLIDHNRHGKESIFDLKYKDEDSITFSCIKKTPNFVYKHYSVFINDNRSYESQSVIVPFKIQKQIIEMYNTLELKIFNKPLYKGVPIDYYWGSQVNDGQ